MMTELTMGFADDNRLEDSIPFDVFQRYHFLVRLLQTIDPAGKNRILEVGAAGSPLKELLPNQNIFDLDLTGNVDIQANATGLPFASDTFDICVSTDVLEHLFAQDRKPFLDEIQRVSRSGFILGFPSANPLVTQADQLLFDFIYGMTGIQYQFLKEHLERGLPDLETISTLISTDQYEVFSYQNANLRSWILMMISEHILQVTPEFIEARKKISTFFNNYFAQTSNEPPTYRSFLLGLRKPVDPAISAALKGIQSSSDPPAEDFALTSMDLALTFQNGLNFYKSNSAAYQEHLLNSIKSLEARLSALEGWEIKIQSLERKLADSQLNEKNLQGSLQRMTEKLKDEAGRSANLEAYLNLFLQHPAYKTYKFLKSFLRLGTSSISTSEITDSERVLAKAYQGRSDLTVRLEHFFTSGQTLHFESHPDPSLSILIVLYNHAELTLRCLESLALAAPQVPFEVIVIDNASSDRTQELLVRTRGIQIALNSENTHFLRAANQAAKLSRGKYLLFLNNDASVLPGSIDKAIESIQSNFVGAVGGKLVFPNGSLQEAGGILWKDGSCIAYGRNDNPFAPQYMYRRDVDYCSAAFLLTPKTTFLNIGGFDETFQPAYYEEVDYCMKLKKKGYRILYEPDVVVFHQEFGSTNSVASAIALQREHQRIFYHRYEDDLSLFLPSKTENIIKSRDRHTQAQRILFIDDRVPYAHLGSGYPRSRQMLLSMLKLGNFITFYPSVYTKETWSEIYSDLPREIEVMSGYSRENLEDFLEERRDYYQTIFISRPHNMETFQLIWKKHPDWFDKTNLIYDAEAIFSLREVRMRELKGETQSESMKQERILAESALAQGSKIVIAVSEHERKVFKQHGIQNAATLGHAVQGTFTSTPFEKRTGFLFVGPIYADDLPNGDALLWFAGKIFPLVIKQIPDTHLLAAGHNFSRRVAELASNHIEICGKVNDLIDLYEKSRVFVAPTRFSAGIPLKIIEAAAYGIPIVTTRLSSNQLGWEPEKDLLIADTEEDFASQCVRLHQNYELWERIRKSAFERILTEFNFDVFETQLRNILNAANMG